jgi:hypothetical protein
MFSGVSLRAQFSIAQSLHGLYSHVPVFLPACLSACLPCLAGCASTNSPTLVCRCVRFQSAWCCFGFFHPHSSCIALVFFLTSAPHDRCSTTHYFVPLSAGLGPCVWPPNSVQMPCAAHAECGQPHRNHVQLCSLSASFRTNAAGRLQRALWCSSPICRTSAARRLQRALGCSVSYLQDQCRKEMAKGFRVFRLLSAGPVPQGDCKGHGVPLPARGAHHLPAHIQVRQGHRRPLRLRLLREAPRAVVDGPRLLPRIGARKELGRTRRRGAVSDRQTDRHLRSRSLRCSRPLQVALSVVWRLNSMTQSCGNVHCIVGWRSAVFVSVYPAILSSGQSSSSCPSICPCCHPFVHHLSTHGKGSTPPFWV